MTIAELTQKLSQKYDSFKGERDGHYKSECRGSYNFAKTLRLIPQTNEEAIQSAYECLETIADQPDSGSVSWEMRIFLRRTPEKYIKIFCDAIKESYQLNKEIGLDMELYRCDVESGGNNNILSFEVIYYMTGSLFRDKPDQKDLREQKRKEFQERLEKLEPELYLQFKEKEQKETEYWNNKLKST